MHLVPFKVILFGIASAIMAVSIWNLHAEINMQMKSSALCMFRTLRKSDIGQNTRDIFFSKDYAIFEFVVVINQHHYRIHNFVNCVNGNVPLFVLLHNSISNNMALAVIIAQFERPNTHSKLWFDWPSCKSSNMKFKYQLKCLRKLMIRLALSYISSVNSCECNKHMLWNHIGFGYIWLAIKRDA